ncbi:hypothetical protein TSAR_013268 [Trichomalopsis sarcophagae]|uniref:Selenoprotein S n=1 Tax=Trichomalopsis sarcophagae TaxID=543379 RepID=A0A232EM80_9HYME|nr:hypothetical protein TSAR_013268 [Trichomalopsis sarcophagae]
MNEEDIDEFEEFNWEVKPPYHKFVWAVIRSVGWYLVGISIVLVYTLPHISKKWNSWKKKKDEKEYDAKYHKNVDLSIELLVATQLARERMQEKYLRDREIALQKEDERKEKKRQELLRLQNQSSGHRLNEDSSENVGPSSSSSKSSRTNLRGEYNPLMGGGSGRYVPPKRSCCKKGGGCG